MDGVYIPFMSKIRTENQWQASIKELKRANCTEIMLIYYRKLANREARDKMTLVFKDNKNKLEAEGFCVSAWVVPTIGYGSPVDYVDLEAAEKYQKIIGSRNDDCVAFCPLDQDFFDDLCSQFAEVAKTGVKKILLEDDFTLSGGKPGKLWGPGCCCDLHMEKLSQEIGENITREKLHTYLTEGSKNKYRDAFYKLSAETLFKMAEGIEKAVHAIDPEIRIGLSANSSSYHFEGADFMELEKVLAGKTKPFVRLTGAPYWKENCTTINPVIETARMQSKWCRSAGIDNLTEGDTFPRPRFLTPASYLEMFDMVLRADGNSNGIYKYMHDYNSIESYETGYFDNHLKNAHVYEEIKKRFKGKNIGLGMFEKPVQISEMDFDETFSYDGFVDHGILPLISQRFVTENSIPTTYEENPEGASLVFGFNAKLLTEDDMKNGLILDINAAKILTEKGVDVGFSGFESAAKPCCEYFIDENDITTTSTERDGGFFRVHLKEKAKVLSEFIAGDSVLGSCSDYSILQDEKNNKYPACYLYENNKGQRFMVYTFAPTYVKTRGIWCNGLFRNYYRQKQLTDGYEWLCGKKLPAVCRKSPYLYILCKRENEKLHVGLFNIFPDYVYSPKIELEREYKNIDCYNCSGKLNGNNLFLNEDIAPYSYAFITLY